MNKLSKDLDKFIEKYGNGGIELTFNLIDFEGVIASAVYNEDTKLLAYKLLGPIDAMLQDRTHVLTVKQYVYQKDKNRLSIHSEGDTIYILRPCETNDGLFVSNTYQLSKEDQELLRYSLELSTK